MHASNMELGNSPYPQLYNIEEDIGQRQNMAQEYPSRVIEMSTRLKILLDSKRTRPGCCSCKF